MLLYDRDVPSQPRLLESLPNLILPTLPLFLPLIDRTFVAALPKSTPAEPASCNIEVPVLLNIPWSAVKSLTVRCPDAFLRAIVLPVAAVS